MKQKLTKQQAAFLRNLAEWGPMFRLPAATQRMARQLRERRLVSFKPETPNLYEMWTITKTGRAALAGADAAPKAGAQADG